MPNQTEWGRGVAWSFTRTVTSRAIRDPLEQERQFAQPKPCPAEYEGTDFETKNKRRNDLITKLLNRGLAPKEQVELDRLQDEVFAYLDAINPGPEQNLAGLVERAKRLGYVP
jgi:hypothetical protein